MGEKKKVLFIVINFIQAGAERYQYEVIKALDKDKYCIDVCMLSTFGSSIYKDEYYYPLVKKIVNNIYHCNEIIGWVLPLRVMRALYNRIFYRIVGINKIASYLEFYLNKISRRPLKKLFANYDIINITDHIFYSVKDVLPDINKLQVHVMVSKMQTFPKSPFDAFDYEKKYNFVVDWTPESQAFEFSEFQNGYNNVRLPLILDTTVIAPVDYAANNQPYKIGIFTRIDYQHKPLDPFFLALHLLINRGLKVHLYIFGVGNPDGLRRLIKMLSLENNVSFEGHQKDLGDCLEKYKLNLAWFQANNYQPGGYAAYEIMLREMPNVFWDFQPLNKKNIQGSHPFPFFWEIEKFVAYTSDLLDNTSIAKELGKIQRQHVIKHQDSKNFIHLLEEVFDQA